MTATTMASPAQTLRAWAAEAEAAAGIARALAPTAFIPDQLRLWTNPDEPDPGKRILDYDGTVAQVTAVLLAGQELGFGPMASLRAFTIIRGQVAMLALAARALLLKAGHEIIVVESTSQRATVRARRADSGEWQEATWDLARAREARLYPGHPNGNWARQTKAMLVARASAEAARWIAADAMLLPVMAEELEAPDGPVGEIESATTAALPPPAAKVQRRSTAPRTALPVAQPPRPPEPRPPAEDAARPHLTKPQQTRIHAGLRAIGITGRDDAARVAGLGMVRMWVGRQVESTSDLTPDEAVTVIEALEKVLAAREQDQAAEPQPPPQPPPEEGPDADPPDDADQREDPDDA